MAEGRVIGGRPEPRWLARHAPIPVRTPPVDLAELAHAVEEDLARPDHAPATERAYAHDWADFAAFCERHALEALPAAPQTLALYLKSLETQRSRSPAGLRDGTVGLSLPTLRRRLAAIASRHATEKLETPTDHPLVKKLLRRYSRSRGTAVKKKEAFTIDRLATLLSAMPDDLPALRDRALLLARLCGGVSAERARGARRRASAVFEEGAVRVDRGREERPAEEGARALRAAAADEQRRCAPSRRSNAGLRRVGATGPVFRTFDLRGGLTANRLDAGDVARILRRRAAAAGVAGDFAGHSLRRGFITNAAKKKVPIENIKRVTGQR